MKHREQLVVWIVWFALLTAVNTYVVVLKIGATRPPSSDPSSLVSVLALVGVVAGGASLVLRNVLLGGFRKGTLSLDTAGGRGRFLTGNVVCFALSEVPGVMGLVAGLQGAAVGSWAALIGLSVLLIWWHVPLPGRFAPNSDGRLL